MARWAHNRTSLLTRVDLDDLVPDYLRWPSRCASAALQRSTYPVYVSNKENSDSLTTGLRPKLDSDIFILDFKTMNANANRHLVCHFTSLTSMRDTTYVASRLETYARFRYRHSIYRAYIASLYVYILHSILYVFRRFYIVNFILD